jgi:DMSO/TMAO reductase YedYZ molybdopterin-dependent catalytic subunit
MRLQEIIALAQPKPNIQYAYFKSADGYYKNWDIASVLYPQSLLAYQKNDRPLPVENGEPLRLASLIKLKI